MNLVIQLYNENIVPGTIRWHQATEFSPLPPADKENISTLTTLLHYHNLSVWHHEDYARGEDKSIIVLSKRNIDIHNQARNNTIETLDHYFAVLAEKVWPRKSAVYNTETIGSIIDRLSIIHLKIYHTIELTNNSSKKSKDLESRLPILASQLDFLLTQGSELFRDVMVGKRLVPSFKQLKMYNDPKFNKHHRDHHESGTDSTS